MIWNFEKKSLFKLIEIVTSHELQLPLKTANNEVCPSMQEHLRTIGPREKLSQHLWVAVVLSTSLLWCSQYNNQGTREFWYLTLKMNVMIVKLIYLTLRYAEGLCLEGEKIELLSNLLNATNWSGHVLFIQQTKSRWDVPRQPLSRGNTQTDRPGQEKEPWLF